MGLSAKNLSLDDIAEVMAETVKSATAHLLARIADLEAKAATLETKSAAVGVRWRGTYRDGDVVAAGELVTCGGSLWLAKRTADTRPGSSPQDFVLICKRGEVAP